MAQQPTLPPDTLAASVLNARTTLGHGSVYFMQRGGGVGAAVVRGLSGERLAVFARGVRQYGVDPLGLTSPLTSTDPLLVGDVLVYKGPYALSLGAGQHAALVLEPRLSYGDQPLEGYWETGYVGNGNAVHGGGSIQGRDGAWSYAAGVAGRTKADYRTGEGEIIPDHMRAVRGGGRLSWSPSARTAAALNVSGTRTGRTAFPGRWLDLSSHQGLDASLRVIHQLERRRWQTLTLKAYRGSGAASLDNRDKPTARFDTTRIVAAPLDITLESTHAWWGGQLSALREGADVDLLVGVEASRQYKEASRTITRANNGLLVLEDAVWPEVYLTMVGGYVHAAFEVEGMFFTGALRLDAALSRAEAVSDFYRQQVRDDPAVASPFQKTDLLLGLAFGMQVPLDAGWALYTGVGSAGRPPSALERYADRFQALESQFMSEVMGRLMLEPERSTQADVTIRYDQARFRGQMAAFVRLMSDYVTFNGTSLDRLVPLDPRRVFRYRSGEGRFWGLEGEARWTSSPALSMIVWGRYLQGTDLPLDEPAIGISPLTTAVQMHYRASRWWASGGGTWVARQDRVARKRGETPTNGFVTVNLSLGWRPLPRIHLMVEGRNLTDVVYRHHANTLNPFTGLRPAEPGRALGIVLRGQF